SRLGNDLNAIVEFHTKNEFWQLVVTIRSTPTFLRGLDQFEDRRERRLSSPSIGSCGDARLRRCFQRDWSSAGVSSAAGKSQNASSVCRSMPRHSVSCSYFGV